MSRKARIMIIGRDGQVARALRTELAASGAEVSAVGRPDIDLLEPETAADAIRRHAPTLVVVPAAYTAVDKAEDEPAAAEAVNAVAPGALARAAADAGAPVIYFSTDYVFDGRKTTPYLEHDTTAPLGVYGATKLAGERAVAAANARHIILRTAWVCSPTGANFVKTMLRLAAERPVLKVVADQRGAPTFAADLARAVAAISARLHADEAGSADPGDRWGVFHLTNAGETTWHGFAAAIVAGSVVRGGKPAAVQAIPTADYPTRARRPSYSLLSNEKIARVYGIRLPPWEASLDACLDTLLGPAPNSPNSGPT